MWMKTGGSFGVTEALAPFAQATLGNRRGRASLTVGGSPQARLQGGPMPAGNLGWQGYYLGRWRGRGSVKGILEENRAGRDLGMCHGRDQFRD